VIIRQYVGLKDTTQPKIDIQNQDKWSTTFQSEFVADFKSAPRYLFGCKFQEQYQFFGVMSKKFPFIVNIFKTRISFYL
jgi:hypothetical protein